MRVHLLAPPNTPVLRACELDGFCQRTIAFAKLLKRLGHEVLVYGVGDRTDAPSDQFLSMMSKDEYYSLVKGTDYQNVPFDGNTPLYLTANHRTGQYIRGTKRKGDVIASITGTAQMIVSQEYNPDLIALEYSIGYRGVGLPYRVFQSYAWRHYIHGQMSVDGSRVGDAVIPPWYDVDDFPFGEEPRDYLVYCGRIVMPKGIHTVCEVAKAANVPLVFIGHGDPSLITYGSYEGAVNNAERNRILSGARACLMPSQYMEPFGNVAAEAQLCGTPVIGPDAGAFVETIEHGRTGYRCNTLGEYVQAIECAKYLDRQYVRDRARRLYSEDAAAASYTTYFTRLEAVQRDGWSAPDPTLEAVSLSDLERVAQ